jgi:hypothetical protein
MYACIERLSNVLLLQLRFLSEWSMGLGQYPEHHGQVLLLRDIPMMKSTLQINHYLGFHEQYENSNRRYTGLNLLPKTWSQIYRLR